MNLDERFRRRLLELLRRAAQADPRCGQFGSGKHQYRLQPPVDAEEVRAAERAYGFQLPEDYFWFITQVGNGGAGPGYGLYPFGNLYQREDFPRLGRAHVLSPKGSPEDYERFIAYYDEDCGDDEYDRRDEELWQGLLTIGTMGCTYQMTLVVSGEARGRVLHVDEDRCRPYFSPDGSFIEWYERWLTETAVGCDMQGFHSRLGGDAGQLAARYAAAGIQERYAILNSMCKFRSVSPRVMDKILDYYRSEEDPACRDGWLRLLTRFDYAGVEPLLRDALKDPKACRNAAYAVWNRYYVHPDQWRPGAQAWYQEVLGALPMILQAPDRDHTPITVILGFLTKGSAGRFRIEDFEPYFFLEDEKTRGWFYYFCASVPMPRRFVDYYLDELRRDKALGNLPLLRDGLSHIDQIQRANPQHRAYLREKAVPLCRALLRELEENPPEPNYQYVLNNIRKLLERLGKGPC